MADIILTGEVEEMLILKAREARGRAYAPYSRFRVGAALLAANGSIYTGCNVENASYGAACCAERSAVFAAVADGQTAFVCLAVAGSGPGYITPCGICRQVLSEFAGDDFPVLLCAQNDYKKVTLSKLLPFAFRTEQMKENHTGQDIYG